MTDLEIVALAITAECLQIDSENLLWSKLKTDYTDLLSQLPHRTKFNKRRKRLTETMNQCLNKLSDLLTRQVGTEILIVDSMPIPICRIVREKISKVCRDLEQDEIKANKGKNIILGGWYIGYNFERSREILYYIIHKKRVDKIAYPFYKYIFLIRLFCHYDLLSSELSTNSYM